MSAARGFVAIALPGKGFAQLTRLYLLQSVVKRYKGVQHQLVPSREQGLAWLREHLRG